MRRRWPRFIAAVAAATVIVALAPATPAYAAQDQAATTVLGFLNQLASWSDGLDEAGALAEKVPLLGISPDSVLDFDSLFDHAFAALPANQPLSALAGEYDLDPTPGEDHDKITIGYSTLAGGAERIAVTINVDKTVNASFGVESTSPKVALSTAGGVSTVVDFAMQFAVVYEQVNGVDTAYMEVGPGAPTMRVNVSADVPIGTSLNGTVGILEVDLATAARPLQVNVALAGGVSDPDGDQRLYFTRPDGNPGELAAAGSAIGLVDVGFAVPPGSAHGTFHVTAAPTTGAINLPGIDATVTVDWTTISNPATLTVGATGFGTVQDFLNLTTRDIADGLGQLTSLIEGIQRARFGNTGNLDLPFMRGTLADAVGINETLVQFLKETVYQPEENPALAGKPKWTSLQDLIDQLDNRTFGSDIAGASLDVAVGTYNGTDRRLPLTLSLTRAAPAAEPLYDPEIAFSGPTATYRADGFDLTGTPFRDSQNNVISLAGRRVVAGTSSGTIRTSNPNDENSIFLDGNWVGGQPAPGTSWSITGPDVQTGLVELGNVLTEGNQPTDSKITEANALAPVATIKPAYSATIKLLLDLQPAVPQNPPLQITNPDGTVTTATELPLGSDRVLVDTNGTQLTADLPITTTIDTLANVGYVRLRVGGTLKVCHPSAGTNCGGTQTAGQHMLQISLANLGVKTLGQLFDLLSDTGASDTTKPDDLLDVTVAARGHASGSVSVPDAASFLPAGLSANFSIDCNSLLDVPSSCGVNTSDLSELFDLDIQTENPTAMLGVVIKTLEALDSGLLGGALSGPLGEKIPLLGISLKDVLGATESGGGDGVTFTNNGTIGGQTGLGTLTDTVHGAFDTSLVGRTLVVGTSVQQVGAVDGAKLTFTAPWATVPATKTAYAFRSEIRDAIDLLVNTPPDALQDSLKVINDRLPGGLAFRYARLDGDDPGSDPEPYLVLDLTYDRNYKATRPVRIDFSTGPTGDVSLVGVRGKGSVGVGVTGHVNVGLAMPLVAGDGPANASGLSVLDNSSISLNASASASGSIDASVGPFSIALGNPRNDAPPAEKISADAKIGVSFAGDSGATGTVSSFTDFLGTDAHVALSSAGANCPASAGVASGTTLAVCASAPVFFSLDGTSWTPLSATDNDFALRLPVPSDPTDIGDFVDLTGTVPAAGGGTLPRFEPPDPAALADKLASIAFDFDDLAGGLDAYLAQIEQGLRLASAGGKLPMVGDDLQEGADFIGDMRTAFNDNLSALGVNGDGKGTIGDLRDAVNGNLSTALNIPPGTITVDVNCGTLRKADGVTATPTPNPPAATENAYTYKVYAYTNNDPVAGRTFASDEASTSNKTDLDADNFNTVKWNKVPNASGYLVFRKIDTGPYQKVADVTALLYEDKDETTNLGPDPGDPSEAPVIADCADDTPPGDVEGIQLIFDIGQGNPTATGCSADCISKTVPIDIGIPGLALRYDRQGDQNAGLALKLGWHMHFAVELNRNDGFVVLTNDQPDPELRLGVAVNLQPVGDASQPDLTAEIAILRVNVEKKQPNVAEFAGLFSVDIKGAGGGTLPAADLFTDPAQFVVPKLEANVLIDWGLQAVVDSALPGVKTDLFIRWGWTTANNPGDVTNLTIQFNNVAVSVGTFFSDVLGPIVDEIKRVTTPLKPVLDTLYAPLPVLSQLAGQDVTIVTLAEAFSTLAGGPDLTFVRRALDVIKLATDIANGVVAGDKDHFITIGSFTIVGQKALDAPATPDRAQDLLAGTPEPGDIRNQFVTNNPHTPLADDGQASTAGFKFPILQQPIKLFGLLLNQDVDIVTWDSGPLTLQFDWRQSFGPVYAPPPVMVTLSGAAGVTAHILAGFDTFGIRKAFELGRFEAGTVPHAILEGLYFGTNDPQTGERVAVLEFFGQIAAGASVSAVIIEVGIEGGVRLTVSFFWRDPNNDGKFRISEFVTVALSNPICLFTVGGRLSLFLKLFVTVGFSPFEVSFDFTIVDVTLLDFEIQPDCDPPPPKLGDVDGTTLYVFAGKLGNNNLRGSPWGNNGSSAPDEESIKIYSLHDYAGQTATFKGFAVEAFGQTQEFLDNNLAAVVVDGRGSTKPMKITFLGDGDKNTAGTGNAPPAKEFEKTAVVFGSDAKDNIRTGTGSAYVDGRGGDDVVQTAQAADKIARVAGGPGNDSLTLLGDGDVTAAGDSALGLNGALATKTLNGRDGDASIETIANIGSIGAPAGTEADATDGNDSIGLGLGTNTAFGNGGADTLGTASGKKAAGAESQTLVGGTGPDALSGGNSTDHLLTATQSTFDPDADGPADPIDPPNNMDPATNNVQSGQGNDIVYGGDGIDIVESASLGAPAGQTAQGAEIYGGGRNDVLSGGFGADKVYGGPEDDYVLAEPSDVGAETGTGDFGPERTVQRKPLPSGVLPSRDRLVGGYGNDHVIGGDGGADSWGDKYLPDQACVAGNPVRSDPVAETADASDGRDLMLGGVGQDYASAGGNNDLLKLFAGQDRGCGQFGVDEVRGGGDNDALWGGSDGDNVFGEAGADEVYGNNGNDSLWGGSEPDTIEGNNGSDTADGGSAADLVVGGTRAAGRLDSGGDTLYGGTEDDTLIGDNGGLPADAPAGTASPYDLGVTAAVPTQGAGDHIFGGDQEDAAYGGLGGDYIDGGNNDDHLEGNNADDTVLGGTGEDELVGGSYQAASAGVGRPDADDTLNGGTGPDAVIGDNGVVDEVGLVSTNPLFQGRDFASGHMIVLLDVAGPTQPAYATSGGDLMLGDTGTDVLLGQGGPDRMLGEADDDYAEGGPGVDYVEGNGGEDDLVGGSSTPNGSSVPGTGTAASGGQPDTADVLWGGPSDDTAIGDNGAVLRGAGITPNSVFNRLGSTPATRVQARQVVQYDLGNGQASPSATLFGADWISGGAAVDVLWGQDGSDAMSGGPGDDYVEGNAGDDAIRGDSLLTDPVTNAGFAVPPQPVAAWKPYPATGAALLEGSGADGQDDVIGGSGRQRFRDEVGTVGNDLVEGNGAGDMVLGDNGTLLRVVTGVDGAAVEAVDAARYSESVPPPADAFRLRVGDAAAAGYNGTTRFCTASSQLGTTSSCEPSWAFGNDAIWGDDGDDRAWGQDGSDSVRGGSGNDDLFGELGGDFLFGEAGEDAILGDRGGVLGEFVDASDGLTRTIQISQVPMESYDILRAGMLDRRTDLLADTNGTSWVGTDAAPVPHAGLIEGGEDRIRGGPGRDSIHAGWDDDLANGDGGGDEVFGDDGADLLWGGRGCEGAECPGGNPAFKGNAKEFIDHVFGGRGGADTDSNRVVQADIIDWNPRGSFEGVGDPDNQCTTDRYPAGDAGTVVDPCEWFIMTEKVVGDAVPDQHHHGTDWIYGGWDRDVMQGNESANGPSELDDRLIDWNGTYNLYSHCNAAYGGYNDIRQQSPDMNTFLTALAYGSGAGRDPDDVTTPTSSAYRELAYVYPADVMRHGSGSAYPTTPGHFDQPAACGT